jgi:hypothetical protein
VLKHKRFHGFRTVRCAAAGASPVATVLRPIGAKNGRYKVCPPLAGSPFQIPGVAFSQQVIHTAYAHPSMSNFVKFESKSIKRRQIPTKAIKKRPVLPCPS